MDLDIYRKTLQNDRDPKCFMVLCVRVCSDGTFLFLFFTEDLQFPTLMQNPNMDQSVPTCFQISSMLFSKWSFTSQAVVSFGCIFQENRTQLLKDLGLKLLEKKRLLAELESYKECDPEVMEEMKRESVIAIEAANRWTGSLYFILNSFPGS